MDIKREMMEMRMEQRREERIGCTKVKSSKDNIEEKVDLYYKELEPLRDEIMKLMNECDGEDISLKLDNIANKLSSIQKFVTDSSLFLPSYDLKKSQTILAGLTSKFQETQDRVQPKKKFGFKNKRKNMQTDTIKVTPSIESDVKLSGKDDKNITSQNTMENCVTVKNRRQETVVVQGDAVNGRDVSISDLVDCRVEILGSPSTLHMSNIQNCTMLSGPVATSVFVEGCWDSTLAVSCQQLRTHDARRCKIYLHTTARAIIEDCSEVQFAPYIWTYPGIDADYTASGLDRKINRWEEVGDFNWLATDTPSPNWSVIPESERVTGWE